MLILIVGGHKQIGDALGAGLFLHSRHQQTANALPLVLFPHRQIVNKHLRCLYTGEGQNVGGQATHEFISPKGGQYPKPIKAKETAEVLRAQRSAFLLKYFRHQAKKLPRQFPLL